MQRILGVKFNELDKQEYNQKIKEFLESEEQHMIFTPNAEMLVDAYHDEYFKEALNRASLNLCDSTGVKFFSGNKLNRIHGVDYFLDICKIAERNKKSIYLLGSGSQRVIKDLEGKLKEKFPELNISGSSPGPKIEIEREEGFVKLRTNMNKNNNILHSLIMNPPDILFVAFGHPKQELWIYKHLKDIPGIKIAMGVGGAFDYISGNVDRAPKWMRKIGMEWLYRLFVQPWRIKRIFKALVIFPVLGLITQVFKRKK